MAPPVQPVDAFTDLAQLASRITQHLAKNPNDQQARDDLKYVTSQMQGPTGAAAAANTQDVADAGGTPEPHPGYSIAAGLGEAAADIPKGIGQALLHLPSTLGQMTGIANIPNMLRVGSDPNTTVPEALDAVIRATPFNMGYAPERALTDATGATSDTPASLEEQTHRAGNVASLALMGAAGPEQSLRGIATPLKVVRGGLSIPGRLLRGTIGRALASGKAVPEAAAPAAEPPPPELDDPVLMQRADVRSAIADYRSGALDRAGLQTVLDFATQDQTFTAGRQAGSPAAVPPIASDALPPRSGAAPFQGNTGPTAGLPLSPASTAGVPPLRPGEQAEPIPGTGGQGIAITGTRATPVPPTSPTILEMQEGRQVPDASAAASQVAQEQASGVRGPGGSMRWSTTQIPSPPVSTPPDALEGTLRASASTMSSPMYQQAGVIARRLLGSPSVLEQFPEFKGLTPEQATAQIQRLMMEQTGRGEPLPNLISQQQFLRALTGRKSSR